MSKQLDEITKQNIATDYLANIRSRDICKKYNIKGTELRKLCKDLNLPKRNKNAIRRKTKELADESDTFKVECLICNDKMRDLTNHLKKNHQLSIEEYIVQYRGDVVSVETREKKSQSAKKRYIEHPELRLSSSSTGKANIEKVNAAGQGWRMPVGYHTEEHKNHMRQLMTGRKITWKEKIRKSHWSRNEKIRKEIVENQSARMAELAANGKQNSHLGKFKKGTYQSKKTGAIELYDSSYELKRMQELDLDPNVLSWTKKHGIRIPYTFNGCIMHYVPDFLIVCTNEILLEEVKGFIKNADQFILKYNAGMLYCLMKEWKFVLNLSYLDHKRKTLWEKKLGLS